MVGITSYGFYVPKFRIKTDDIASHWGKCGDKVEKTLKIVEKAVASEDEDILTMAYEASSMAISSLKNIQNAIGAVFLGSETFAYAVKPTSTSLAGWLGLSEDYLALDTQFACKAATGALIAGFSLVKAGECQNVLICASDKANARQKDSLEYSAGSGANAWLIGKKDVILEIVNWHSVSSDTPDFWRRSKADFPSHAGRFTGEPAYFYHIENASKKLLKKSKMKPEDFKYAVFHMPNGSFPTKVAMRLGFTKDQILPSLVVSKLGNSYSASALMGLASTLDYAKAGEKIFFASYGSGAGSDAIIFNTTANIVKNRKNFEKVLKNKKLIDYGTYQKFMGM